MKQKNEKTLEDFYEDFHIHEKPPDLSREEELSRH